jgi:transposase-like protein
MNPETRPRQEVWRELISQHRQSGVSVKAFCQKQGVCEQSFYSWRKRLTDNQPARFALVETSGAAAANRPALELVLASGDRLQIAPGVDAATLRTVLTLLRERA